jgi:hypothetical protein
VAQKREGSSLYLQEPATGPNPEATGFAPHHAPNLISLRSILIPFFTQYCQIYWIPSHVVRCSYQQKVFKLSPFYFSVLRWTIWFPRKLVRLMYRIINVLRSHILDLQWHVSFTSTLSRTSSDSYKNYFNLISNEAFRLVSSVEWLICCFNQKV